MSDPTITFVQFADSRAGALRRTACLLTGNWADAEDLTQATLAKLYVVWGRLHSRDNLDAYARQTLTRLYLSERRLRRFGERLDAWPEGLDAGHHPVDLAEDRIDLLAALATLPLRQRTVLVLRYWEDLSVESVAELIGSRPGTVKSLASRGLEALRAELSLRGISATTKGDDQ